MEATRRWRRAIPIALVLVSIWTVGPGALAKPDRGGTKAPVLAVEIVDVLGGHEMWSILEAPGDTVAFAVTVDGVAPGNGTLDVAITTADGTKDRSWVTTDGTSGPYAVQAEDIVDGLFAGTVTYTPEGDEPLVASFGMEQWRIEECGWTTSGPDVYEGDFPDLVTCRWQPTTPATWEVELTAELQARVRPKAPTSVFVTLRDHYPGNWCAVSEDGQAGLRGNLRPGETATLPSGELLRYFTPDTGICLRGGAGGDTIGVGNPATFVFAVEGHLKLTRVGD